jgi:hypothetical protein
MTPDRGIETAADYADALMTARSAKHLLVLMLVLMILGQIAIFFVARYKPGWIASPLPGDVMPPTTSPTQTPAIQRVLHFVTGGINFLGIALSIVLAMVLLLIVNVMLVGRLIGISRVTSAYIWCLVLIVLLFPWQAFLNNVNFTADWKIPGILYNWEELGKYAQFDQKPMTNAILKWARFVGFPVMAILILLTIQVKSSRGLRQALGEADLSDAA